MIRAVLPHHDEELENRLQEKSKSEHCTKIDFYFISSWKPKY